MRISYIREFLILAKTSNYGKAAKELYISQTALFNHIKILEEEIGEPLFEKTGRGIRISKYGQLFLPYARELVETYTNFEKDLEETKLTASQQITIGTQYRIADLIKSFSKSPERYILNIRDAKNIEDSLYRDGCELAFIRDLQDPDEKYNSIPYVHDRVVAVLYRSHPLAGRKFVHLNELRNERFIIPAANTGPERAQSAVVLCQKAGFTPRVTMTVLTGTDAANAVNEELGISLLLLKTLHWASWENICLVELEPVSECHISLCWRKDIPLSPSAERFVHFVEANHHIS